MTLVFNPITKQQISSLVNNLPHAVLLSGPIGAGLLTTARHIAGANVAAIIVPQDKDDQVNLTKGSISVKRIRQLYTETRTKTLTRRVFIIDNAEKMTHGAQNAFLKLLEEPASNVHFILTSHFTAELLPTIRSRLEEVIIQPITNEQTESILNQHKLTGAKAQQSLFIGAGKPAELARLGSDSEYFAARAKVMQDAKTYLNGKPLQKVAIAFKYAENRENALQLLDACRNILLFSVKHSKNAAALNSADRLASAYSAISANANTRLQLLAAML